MCHPGYVERINCAVRLYISASCKFCRWVRPCIKCKEGAFNIYLRI